MNITKVHIPLKPGIELVLDTDISLGIGIAETGQFILHCRKWDFEIVVSPIGQVYERDGVIK